MKNQKPSFLECLFQNPTRFALVVVGFLLSGCATKSVGTEFAFTPESETGLIIGSASSSQEDSWYSASVRFFYAKANDENPLGASTSGFIQALPRNPLLGTTGPSEFQGTDGSLFAIALPPGDYVFSTWDIDNGSQAIIYPVDPKPLTFKVRKGEATYIGNLHMFLRTGKNLLGITIIADGRPIIADKSDRDIPLLLERYPNIMRADIRIEIIDDRPWGGKGPPARIEAQLAD